MKRVIIVTYDYDSMNQEEWAENFPGVLIDEYTLLKKSEECLDVYWSKTPIEVLPDGAVLSRGLIGVEIKLNELAKNLDVFEIATMTVADLTKYLQKRGY